MKAIGWMMAVAMVVGCSGQVEDLSYDEQRLGLEFDAEMGTLVHQI